jgi:hypothetical protein
MFQNVSGRFKRLHLECFKRGNKSHKFTCQFSIPNLEILCLKISEYELFRSYLKLLWQLIHTSANYGQTHCSPSSIESPILHLPPLCHSLNHYKTVLNLMRNYSYLNLEPFKVEGKLVIRCQCCSFLASSCTWHPHTSKAYPFFSHPMWVEYGL